MPFCCLVFFFFLGFFHTELGEKHERLFAAEQGSWEEPEQMAVLKLTTVLVPTTLAVLTAEDSP